MFKNTIAFQYHQRSLYIYSNISLYIYSNISLYIYSNISLYIYSHVFSNDEGSLGLQNHNETKHYGFYQTHIKSLIKWNWSVYTAQFLGPMLIELYILYYYYYYTYQVFLHRLNVYLSQIHLSNLVKF